MFLKRHSATLPQKDLSYHQPIDGNLPSALYRPNSLEQLFNSLQNGTIDNETPEKDYMNQILDDIGSIYTLQEVESRPSIAAFRYFFRHSFYLKLYPVHTLNLGRWLEKEEWRV